MGGLETLIGALGLSFVSGINLYAAVLVVGLGLRYGWFPFLPEELNALSDPASVPFSSDNKDRSRTSSRVLLCDDDRALTRHWIGHSSVANLVRLSGPDYP